MRSRLVWFTVGTAAGVYTAVRTRRAAYRFSAPGIVDQAAALGLGWRAFSSELRDGMATHEREIARRLAGDADDPHLLSLDQAHPDNTLSTKDVL
ncbi:MAG: hypothetical protein JWP31_920 [Aeromicrobium sp.]|nr:hypothetical protein [Aeromicrobium sp.]